MIEPVPENVPLQSVIISFNLNEVILSPSRFMVTVPSLSPLLQQEIKDVVAKNSPTNKDCEELLNCNLAEIPKSV